MPSFRSLLSLAALAALAQAITITSPGDNAVWDVSKTNTITWTTVSTDPSAFDVYLAHMASQPQLNDKLFSNVPAGKGSLDVSGLQLPTGTAYQINFVKVDSPDQLYAQSQQFNVTGEAVAATSTLDGYIASGTAAAVSTSTVSTGSSTTATKLSTVTSSVSSTKSTASSSGSSSTSSSAPVATGNAAVELRASAPLAALIFGAFALLA